MTIEVKDLSKTLKGVTVLENINTTIKPGTITGIRGINGSGKTMLLRAIAGLIKPSQGSIKINGKRLWQDIDFPESIGVLIENPAFLSAYSAFQNLSLLASIKGIIGEDQIRTAIASVGLNPNDKKKYRKFSLGMKQRLGIAAALMERPDIVLLDEPNNGLDTDGITLLKELVLQEKARGATVVMACHDTGFLNEIADEILFLELGKISDHLYNKKERSHA